MLPCGFLCLSIDLTLYLEPGNLLGDLFVGLFCAEALCHLFLFCRLLTNHPRNVRLFLWPPLPTIFSGCWGHHPDGSPVDPLEEVVSRPSAWRRRSVPDPGGGSSRKVFWGGEQRLPFTAVSPGATPGWSHGSGPGGPSASSRQPDPRHPFSTGD
jgi:hypothetical protein